MKEKLKLLVLVLVALLPGAVKIVIYRHAFGARIDAGVRIGFGTLLLFDSLTLERDARIGNFNIIRVASMTLGKRSRIGSCCRITCNSFVLGSSATISSWVSILADHRDPQATFEAGSESWIFDFCYINPARPIKLGRNVGVGGGSYLFGHGLWLSKLKGYPISFGPITIEDDVWLPWGCFIMPGVSIGTGAVVGARAVVTKSLPAGALAAGMPAKVIRESVAAAVPLETQLQLLQEATDEFAALHGHALSVETSAEWIGYAIAAEPVFSLARVEQPTTFPPDRRAELCVVHGDYRSASTHHPRVYSLASSQCCDYESLGGLQKQWLNHLRLLGVRYYPIDEVAVE